MQLQSIDWVIVAVYGVASLIIGLLFTKRAGRSLEQYFLSGRKLPWWLLGTSMVATTFSTDTPNLVTDLVRTGGVSMNWLWWAFLITGMLTVFFYAKLWRRSGALTDINFYELRYSGAPAAFLRGFRAIYLGVFFNVMIMATVTLAAIKIAGVLFGLDAHVTVVLAALITMVYSRTAGLWGVVVTDFFQFALAMIGSIAAAYYAVTHPSVGGLDGLFSNPLVKDKLSLLPDFSDRAAVIAVLIVPLAVQWWSTWYPGSEPGGGGYMAQRMLAARNEKQAMAATLWFNIAHYARAAVAVDPRRARLADRLSGARRHPGAPSLCRSLDRRPRPRLSGHARVRAARAARAGRGVAGGRLYVDDQHPSQLGRLLHRRRRLSPLHPPGCLASALCERRRAVTFALMILAALVALWLDHAMQAFQILLQIGAGTGLIFLLRWFWWRINAWGEIAAMVISFLVAVYLHFGHARLGFAPLDPTAALVLGVMVTTVGWLAVTLLDAANRSRRAPIFL